MSRECSVQELAGQLFSASLGTGLTTAGLDLLEGLATPSELLQNRFDRGGPDEGFRVVIPCLAGDRHRA